jgi:5-methylcytosine-specific restriction endonuclease McrA
MIFCREERESMETAVVQAERFTKEYFAQKQREYRQRHKLRSRAQCRKYYQENRAEIIKRRSERRRDRLKADPIYAFKTKIYSRFRKLFAEGNADIADIVGCDYKQLMKHLRRSYRKNYGNVPLGTDLEIDHIIPLESATEESQVLKLWHFTNLQYLRVSDNRSKGPRMPEKEACS